VERDLGLDAAALDGVVHAVEAPEEGRLAAAGRADQGGDLVALDVEVDAEQRLLASVEDADVAPRHGRARGFGRRRADIGLGYDGGVHGLAFLMRERRPYHRRSSRWRRKMATA